MGRNFKLERLQRGETFVTSEKGNSMVPLISSGQEHILEPATWETVEVGDIAYCKVKGNWYTHLVTAKNDSRGCQISNNSGYVNGWTKAVYGVVTEVIGGKYKRKTKIEMKTIKELLEPITSRGLGLIVCVDTYDFKKFCEEKFDMTSSEWHDKVWRPYMCDHFMDGAYKSFSRKENPKNIFEEQLNTFFDEYPEFGDRVSMIFTN